MELFMVVRHREIDFASGALVFPGGSVDKHDRDERVRAITRGSDGLDDNTLALQVAAVREAFEECGVLLARKSGQSGIVAGDHASSLGEKYRKDLEAGNLGIAEMAVAEDLELAIDQLSYFAHWITPSHAPKRFDTHFFIAEAPEGHDLSHDGREAVDSIWITPDAAIKGADDGTYTIVTATRLNIQKIGRSSTPAEARATADASPVVTVQPDVTVTETGRILRIPIEAGYGFSEIDASHIPSASDKPKR